MKPTLPRITYRLTDLRGDVFGGVTAGTLILPQAMGYGIVAGMGPVAGLYGAIAVCFFAAVFGGTRGMIGGPNMFVAVTMAVVVAEYADNLAEALTAAMLAGLMQVGFAALRLGRYVSYMPHSLMAGFFIAIGLLVIVSQILPVLGSPIAAGGVVGAARAWPEAVRDVNIHALAVAAISLGVAVFWPSRLSRLVPAQLMALVLAALAGMLVFQDAPVIGTIPFEMPSLQSPVLSAEVLVRMLEPAFIIALLSSVTTLTVALQIDAITGTQHQPNREMFAQGVGNITAGAVGGVPGGMTGATIANVANGGRSQIAGLVAVSVVLLMVLGVRQIAEEIPYAALSGILIIVGWNLMDRRFLARIHRIPRSYVFVAGLTVLLAVFVDLVDAMLVGLVAAALVGARRSEGPELEQLISVPLLDRVIIGEENMDEDADPFGAQCGLVVFPDRVSVASARELIRIVGRDVGGHRVVIFDLSKTVYVDDTAAAVLGQLVNSTSARTGREFVIAGLRGEVAGSLNSLGSLTAVPPERLADDLDEAKRIVGAILRPDGCRAGYQ